MPKRADELFGGIFGFENPMEHPAKQQHVVEYLVYANDKRDGS
jgi:hypothetical protein